MELLKCKNTEQKTHTHTHAHPKKQQKLKQTKSPSGLLGGRLSKLVCFAHIPNH